MRYVFFRSIVRAPQGCPRHDSHTSIRFCFSSYDYCIAHSICWFLLNVFVGIVISMCLCNRLQFGFVSSATMCVCAFASCGLDVRILYLVFFQPARRGRRRLLNGRVRVCECVCCKLVSFFSILSERSACGVRSDCNLPFAIPYICLCGEHKTLCAHAFRFR